MPTAKNDAEFFSIDHGLKEFQESMHKFFETEIEKKSADLGFIGGALRTYKIFQSIMGLPSPMRKIVLISVQLEFEQIFHIIEQQINLKNKV